MADKMKSTSVTISLRPEEVALLDRLRSASLAGKRPSRGILNRSRAVATALYAWARQEGVKP